MKSLAILGLTLALIALGSCNVSAQTKPTQSAMSQQEIKHLLQGKFRPITKVSELPSSVKRAFPDPAMQKTFTMADPGQEWQVTDVIMKRDLPTRRLIFAGLSDDYCVLHYERGGIAHSFSVLVFRVSKNDAHLIGRGNGMKPYPDLPKLLKTLQAEGVDTETGSYYY